MMPTSPRFDSELLRRYDRPGPRYTSYPTAPQFTGLYGESAFCQALKQSNEDPIPRPLSLYAHIPFCFSPCFYCGCNRVITRDRRRAAVYVEQLQQEITRVARRVDRDREVIQLHFGGGTPNFLEPEQIGALIHTLFSGFRPSLSPDRDFSIELDPRTIDPDGVAQLAEFGINRASLGVQDFDPEVQAAINRLQSIEQTEAVLNACRQNGMRSINIDLIYGLPKQTEQGFAATLDRVIEQRPDRLAIYSYAHLPQLFKAQRQIETEHLPSPEVKLALLGLAIDKLGAAGYRYIGMDHFALPEDDLSKAQDQRALHRNFMGYTTHAESDLIGFGVSAISHIGRLYSQNQRDLSSWQRAIDQGQLAAFRGIELDRDDLLRADLIQQLMCHGEIDIPALEQRHEIDFSHYFANSIERLQALMSDGLVELNDQGLRATARGRLLLRNIAMCFDRYLNHEEPRQFSKAI